MKVKEVTVRFTKQLEKDLDDLERCAAGCDNARDRKTLERISKNLRKHLGRGQHGGMAPVDPAVFNLGGLLNTDGNPIDAGAAGVGLMNIPSPFYENNMNTGALFSPETGASFIPSAYHPTLPAPAQAGGASKKRTSKSKKNA